MKKILLTGGTGLVGSRFIELTDEMPYEFYIMTRSAKADTARIKYINWDDINRIPDIDLVINLAGASLSQRWTSEHKKAIAGSRIESTRKLKAIIDRQQTKPFLITASAVGYYPPAKHLTYTEKDTFKPFDFLSETVSLWEQEAQKIEDTGVQTAYCRFGVIFSDKGGALPLMIKPYQFYIGGNIGDGQQVYSWIHIDDLIHALLYIYHHQLTGVYNITAPNPATQEEVGKAIAATLHKPHMIPVPDTVLDVVLGEQSIMVTDGQRVLPKKLQEAGYDFTYPTIDKALVNLYGQ
ncbi:TIGR01777 family protein [Macrococcus hajekii]|uniref:TIGR01777 family protein n=1 Tax=Macrococcus hajekii TaxID=198482 RepID=A0A4R6BJR4_9STAP|nr:TIGR01777 family oxidoreductase [Macrococcus hajekii]TDM01949.1 TIGR01777 family protein [Macrococcus hajekii]GGB08774.1 epimerase [Macrococcus hajekii]